MRVVSFGQIIPHAGVTVAGGQFYLEHIAALEALGHHVLVVAPRMSRHAGPNAAALSPFAVEPVRSRTGRSARVWRQVDRLFVGAVSPDYRRDVLASEAVRRAVEAADLVEYQWVESMSLARSIEPLRARPGPSLGVVHDEIVQRERRRAATSTGLRALVRSTDVAQAAARERGSFGRMTDLLTISRKDADLCSAVDARPRTHVVLPPIVDTAKLSTSSRRGGAGVLMVGTFSRTENDEAARWFLTEVWPMVLRRHPAARFVIAGADPSDDLHRLGAATPGATVAGFVADLDAVYRDADVVVVPLHAGAGVKFKTVEGLARGIPVVSTTIGAEGILEGERDVFSAVADDAAGFAAGVIAALEATDADRARAFEVGRRVAESYGKAGYRTRLGVALERVMTPSAVD